MITCLSFNRLKVCAVVLLIVVAVGCTSSSSTTGDGTSTLNLDSQQAVAVTDGSGQGTFSFNLAQGQSAFQMVASTPGGQQIRIRSVVGPSGKKLIDESTASTVSGAVVFQSSPVTFSAPVLVGVLLPGTYTVTVEIKGPQKKSVLGGVEIPVSIVFKSDANFNSGTLRVNLIMVGPIGDSTDMQDGFESAFDIMKEIYDQAGISLDPKWYDWAGPGQIPNPASGSSFYLDIANAVRGNAVNIVIGETVQGANGREDKYSISGSSPGPAIPTVRSAVAIAALKLTGTDGKFNYGRKKGDSSYNKPGSTQVNSDETLLAAEEMSQVTAHYLGLSHIVEFNGGSVAASADALTDTVSCTTVSNCRLDEDARSNLAFPFPLTVYTTNGSQNNENNGVDTYTRDILTDQQRAVLNRSSLVE